MPAMIDLVFLLLIFFMVASKMITVVQIEGVTIPVASAADVPKDAKGRVVLNITTDGRILDAKGTRQLQTFEVQQMMAAAKQDYPAVRLHLRADQDVEHRVVKEVIEASARGGVTSIVFSTYQSE